MENIKYRLTIVEYTTLKGFGNSCSIEKSFDNINSAREALSFSEEQMKHVPNAHIEYNGNNMGFIVVDNTTNLILGKTTLNAYSISEDGREFMYRGHKISTQYDNELERDVLVVHRMDGREYIFRSTLEYALDTIDWLCCTMENASIARMALEKATKEKKEVQL